MAKNKRRNKKAVFFSLDALIALIIILLTIIVIYPIIRYSEKESYVPEDIISSLSALKIGDINSGPVTIWISEGKIKNLNKSVLEQIGEFYVSQETKPMAIELANIVLSTISTNENVGIWMEGNPNPIASRSTISYNDAKNVNVERQVISGIQEGEDITGYSARAFLSNSEQTKYYYFGGYVGEGNITVNINYTGALSKAELEIATNKNFKICINNNPCSDPFVPATSELEPKYFDLESYKNSFEPGINTFRIIPADGEINFHVAGGYLRLTYSDGVQYEEPVKYYFPGIEGIINLYDGFYIPGDLNKLEVHLKAKINDPVKKVYMRLGDTLIFNISTGGNLMNIDYDDADISSILTAAGKDYSDYSRKTIPVRIAIEGLDYVQTEVIAEVFSEVMLSGSINSQNVMAKIDGTDYYKDEAVKRTNKKLVDILLSLNDNVYLGLIPSKDGSVYLNGYHGLSTDEDSLKSKIDNWEHGTGIKDFCSSIQKSVDEFTPASGFRAVILSVFDSPNQCNIWESDPEFIAGGATLNERIKTRVCNLAAEKNITFYTVEMNLGYSVTAQETRAAIIEMADCSGGKYVRADDLDGGLMDAYNTIITDIISLIYNMQIVNVIESADASSYLSPDSYIEFDYTKTSLPYGLVTTSEKTFTDDYNGNFDIPADSDVVETKVVSYSGSRWTKDIEINGNVFYDLDNYGSEYIVLGDPYAINIPNSIVIAGSQNNVVLRTAIDPASISPGSVFNKIIYTIVKDMVSYSAISSSANGCIWEVEFEDEIILVIPVPSSAIDTCYYKSDNHEPPSSEDALKIAVYNLFKKLDNDGDGRVDIKFSEQNLQVSSSEVTGIPYPWETVIQVRKWW